MDDINGPPKNKKVIGDVFTPGTYESLFTLVRHAQVHIKKREKIWHAMSPHFLKTFQDHYIFKQLIIIVKAN